MLVGYSFNKLNGVDLESRRLQAVIEIPQGSHHKIEWDRQAGYFILDRILPKVFCMPFNYGFIPQTLDGDGDELDLIILTDQALTTGIVVPRLRVLGVLRFIDDDQDDHKIITVVDDDYNQKHYQKLDDLPESLRLQIDYYFSRYKDLTKPGRVTTDGFGDQDQAWEVIADCRNRALKQPWW